MAAQNFYIGVKRGQNMILDNVVSGTSSAGTAVDVEINMQLNDGTNAIGLTRQDVNLAIEILRAFINSGGVNAAGANLPPL